MHVPVLSFRLMFIDSLWLRVVQMLDMRKYGCKINVLERLIVPPDVGDNIYCSTVAGQRSGLNKREVHGPARTLSRDRPPHRLLREVKWTATTQRESNASERVAGKCPRARCMLGGRQSTATHFGSVMEAARIQIVGQNLTLRRPLRRLSQRTGDG
jgi:hypothetical protein